MTEYEILDLLTKFQDSFQWRMQWWGGISFGLMAFAHFAGRRLTGLLAIGILVLYSIFSVFVLILLIERGGDISIAVDALAGLGDTSVLGASKARRVDALPLIPLILASYIGTFGATVFYLVYCYRKARESNLSASAS